MIDSPVIAVKRQSLNLLHNIANSDGRGGLLIQQVFSVPLCLLGCLPSVGDIDMCMCVCVRACVFVNGIR
jgi:hypothetical protein